PVPEPLGVLICDIDHFKHVNDTHGHLIGDEVIINVAETLKTRLRENDIIARVGGEEFICIIPGLSREMRPKIDQKICDIIRNSPIETSEGTNLRLTISIGATWISPDTGTVNRKPVFETADNALYTAKYSGRDRVVFNTDIVEN